MEKQIPEINFLTASGGDIKPGSILESQNKDIVIGYLPKYFKNIPPFNEENLSVIEVPYNIQLDKISGITSANGALNIMNSLGLKYDSKLNYKIDLEINEITSFKFANDLGIIDFEQAIEKLAKTNKSLFKKIKNHYLVIRVIYAGSYKVTIDIEKNEKFEADNKLEGIDFKGSAEFKKEENSVLINNNKDVPFGVICFKIKKKKLKEKDR
ncbi:MAG: hypothetical protein HQ541_15190 [Mariniphaga sp.]|nr:hypothetical protein [Mariniphaga sp.]